MTEAQVTEVSDAEALDPASVDQVESTSERDTATPGSILREAREARGHSIADVVQVIRFSARQIEALERDDYDSLPGSTATRGLIRNYAKFLKLDPAPLLAQLDPSVPPPEADVRPPANMGEAEQPSLIERVPPRIIAAIVAVVLVALSAYWYSGLPDDNGKSRRSSAPEAGMPAAQQQPATPPDVPTVTPPSPAVLVANEPVNAEVPPGLPSPGALRVEFDERSWVEIRDATHKVVFVGEYPAGTRQNVSGKAPFQIWIGRASAVRLFMGERSIDLKPHTREDVARLSLE